MVFKKYLIIKFIKLKAGVTMQVTNLELVNMFVADKDANKVVIPKAIKEFNPLLQIGRNRINKIAYEKVRIIHMFFP